MQSQDFVASILERDEKQTNKQKHARSKQETKGYLKNATET